MRILIADDNAALLEILAEVVSGAGHTIETASSADGALSAIGSFHPDAVLLDIDMQKGKGIALLDLMQNSTPPSAAPVIIIRSRNRQIPQDSPAVRGCVEKPFTSREILESIEMIQAGGAETDEPAGTIIKQAEAPKASEAALAERGISFGRSYVLFQNSPDAVHELISKFGAEGYDVLIVTAGKKKTMIERFRNSRIRTLTLKIRLFSGRFSIYGLGTMMDSVEEFVAESGRPVVAFDDLNRIIDRNGMNSSLTAIHQMVTKKYGKDMTFLVSVDPKGFTAKDKEILLKYMEYHDPIGE
jgi:CheY-like chemotaxis protein